MTARILVVDDTELNVKLLEAKLSSEYFDVLKASNGPAALRIAAAEQQDLVLLDVMMPQMDGFEVCRRLKADRITADIPVVMVTALSDVADRLRGLDAGADDFLTKPTNDVALFARVRSLVRLRRMMQELRLRDEICGRLANGAEDAAAEELPAAHILLVERDDRVAARLMEILRPVAAAVTRATSCAEAHDLLDDATELVIASLSIPDDDALRFVSRCRANEGFRELPILLTADADELARLARGLDLGANDYLVRPVDRSELVARTTAQLRRKRLQQRLRESQRRSLSLALTDDLTGLYNRRYALAHLEELIGRAASDPSAVLLFDIDKFKWVNDTYGHVAGDDALRELAARTMRSVRSADLVARIGGEEFLVVMPESTLDVGVSVAERLRASIASQPFTIHESGERWPLTISIGVTTIAECGDTAAAVLKRADDALYLAKNSGRNRVTARAAQPVTFAAAS